MPTTDWLIGSHPSVPECTFTVSVGATDEDFSIAAGAYYLWDNGSGYDILQAFEDAINSHSLITGATVFLGQDRLVHANHASTSFTVTWTGDTTARNIMGFTGTLASGTTHTAAAMSALFWSPGKEGSPDARLGTLGDTVYDTQMTMAGTGVVSTVQHNSYRQNGYTWRYVDNALVHSTSENSGEWFTFFDQVVRQGRKLKLLREVNEDTTSTTAATMTGDLLGPYVVRSTQSPWKNVPQRSPGFEFVERRNDVAIKMNTVPEYS